MSLGQTGVRVRTSSQNDAIPVPLAPMTRLGNESPTVEAGDCDAERTTGGANGEPTHGTPPRLDLGSSRACQTYTLFVHAD